MLVKAPTSTSRETSVFVTLVIAVLLLLPFPTLSQDDLPIEVRADLIQRRIYDQLRVKELDAVLSSIDELETLDAPFPLPLRWVEARAAHQQSGHGRAFAALKTFLRTAERISAEYKTAVAVFDDYRRLAERSLSEVDRLLIGSWSSEPRQLAGKGWAQNFTDLVRTETMVVSYRITENRYFFRVNMQSELTLKPGYKIREPECAGVTTCTLEHSSNGVLRISGDTVVREFFNSDWDGDDTLTLDGQVLTGYEDDMPPMVYIKEE